MTEPEFIVDSKRHLPHKQLTGCVLFITWRLAFTLPKAILNDLAMIRSNYLKERKKSILADGKNKYIEFKNIQFNYFDDWIDNYKECKHNLTLDPYSNIIKKVIHSDENIKYILSAYCIMSNHIHLVIKPLTKNNGTFYTITELTGFLKSITAHKINKALSLKGQVWQHESYDRIIRDENEYLDTVKYVIMNPVKAGLVDKWDNWSGTYLCKELL